MSENIDIVREGRKTFTAASARIAEDRKAKLLAGWGISIEPELGIDAKIKIRIGFRIRWGQKDEKKGPDMSRASVSPIQVSPIAPLVPIAV